MSNSISVAPTLSRFIPDPEVRYNNAVTLATALVILTSPYWILRLFEWDTSGTAFVVVPLIVGFNLLLVIAASRTDQFLRRCMVGGLLFKVACASIYLAIASDLYNWTIDVYGYMNEGSRWASQLQTIGKIPILTPLRGTNFITMITGSMIYVFGPSFAITAMFYAMLAFWGQFFAYKAFRTAFPNANRKLAAIFLLFFVPSIVYWTAMVGKDAVLSFSTGLAVYGFAQLTRRLNFAGMLTMGAGLGLMVMTRGHVAAVFLIAATVSIALQRNVRGAVGAATRLVAIPLVLGMTIYIGLQASETWSVSDFQQGLQRQVQAGKDTASGGSAFSQAQSSPVRFAMAPLLMFRPFPWEIRNWQTLISAAESFWILVLCWQGRRGLLSVLGRFRAEPMIMFILLYLFEFLFAFAPGINNFGLLVRQRVMVLPFLMMLLCIPEANRAEGKPLRRAFRPYLGYSR